MCNSNNIFFNTRCLKQHQSGREQSTTILSVNISQPKEYNKTSKGAQNLKQTQILSQNWHLQNIFKIIFFHIGKKNYFIFILTGNVLILNLGLMDQFLNALKNFNEVLLVKTAKNLNLNILQFQKLHKFAFKI